MSKCNSVIGIDIGGVIISRSNDNTDTSFFGGNYLCTTPCEGAFESIKRMRQSGFIVYLVSKCGESIEKKTRHWLAHHDFYKEVGMPEENLRFCRTRPEKSGICREIEASYFIDDRLEVLSYLETVPNKFLLNSVPKEVRKFGQYLAEVTVVQSWPELTGHLLKFSPLEMR